MGWRRKEDGCYWFRWLRYLFIQFCHVLISISFSFWALFPILFCNFILCHLVQILLLLIIFFLLVCGLLQLIPLTLFLLDFLDFFFGRYLFYCTWAMAFCDIFIFFILLVVPAFFAVREIYHHRYFCLFMLLLVLSNMWKILWKIQLVLLRDLYR